MDDDKLFDDEEEKPKIKVTDRRKFTAQGDLREAEAPAEETAADEKPSPTGDRPKEEEPSPPAGRPTEEEPSASGDRQQRVESPPAAADRPTAQQPADERAGTRAGSGAAAPGIADLPRDFTAFLEGMYLEAMLYLGAVPDPRTGEPAEDLDMAKYKIDLLGMIEEKTRGNLTDEEAQQLEEVLYQLRMFFIQRSKGGAE